MPGKPGAVAAQIKSLLGKPASGAPWADLAQIQCWAGGAWGPELRTALPSSINTARKQLRSHSDLAKNTKGRKFICKLNALYYAIRQKRKARGGFFKRTCSMPLRLKTARISWALSKSKRAHFSNLEANYLAYGKDF